ncbi:MAG: sigma-70 family RNA polymerase sigma factor [Pirellulales bacterium]
MAERIVDERIKNATRRWTLVQPVVSAFVYAVVRDFTVRDDLVQDIAVAVLESYERFDESRSFQAWALGIARNHVRNYLKREARDVLIFDDQLVESLAVAFDEHANRNASKLDYLQGCLDKLDYRSRKILELRYARDLKPAEMAISLDRPANTVAKTLQRIRDVLRECINRQAAAEGSP